MLPTNEFSIGVCVAAAIIAIGVWIFTLPLPHKQLREADRVVPAAFRALTVDTTRWLHDFDDGYQVLGSSDYDTDSNDSWDLPATPPSSPSAHAEADAESEAALEAKADAVLEAEAHAESDQEKMKSI
jgi:hypothetical protein